MKAARHDLKGLMHYYQCSISELRVPLMALVDYRGFRLIAMSLLPINSATICYGSPDAGQNVYNSDSHMSMLMQKASFLLNLKPHEVNCYNLLLLHS